MDEEKLKAEMRLSAIEFLLADLTVKVGRIVGGTNERFAQWHDELRERANRRAFPGLDPVMSDLAAAEFESALVTQLNAQRELLGLPKLQS